MQTKWNYNFCISLWPYKYLNKWRNEHRHMNERSKEKARGKKETLRAQMTLMFSLVFL